MQPVLPKASHPKSSRTAVSIAGFGLLDITVEGSGNGAGCLGSGLFMVITSYPADRMILRTVPSALLLFLRPAGQFGN